MRASGTVAAETTPARSRAAWANSRSSKLVWPRRYAAYQPVALVGSMRCASSYCVREPRLDPGALGAAALRRGQIRAKRGHALRVTLGRETPPAEPRPARFEQRVRPALHELIELLDRPLVLADTPQRLAEPERDVA